MVSKMTCIWSLIYQYTYVWIGAFTYHTCMYVRWKSFREICFSLIDFVVFKVSSNSIKAYMHIFNVFLIKCLPVDISWNACIFNLVFIIFILGKDFWPHHIKRPPRKERLGYYRGTDSGCCQCKFLDRLYRNRFLFMYFLGLCSDII